MLSFTRLGRNTGQGRACREGGNQMEECGVHTWPGEQCSWARCVVKERAAIAASQVETK